MTATAASMRLALRRDAYWAATPGGIHILTHRGPVSLTGSSVHQLIEGLAPYLDGRFTLAELTADLPEQRRAAVESLVVTLLDRDVLREVPPPTMAAADDEYAPEYAFVGYFRDCGAYDAYRRRAALVVGDGDGGGDEVLGAVAIALLRSGLARVAVAGAGERAPEFLRLAGKVRRDQGQRLSLHELADNSAGAVLDLLDSLHDLDDSPEPGGDGGGTGARIVVHASADPWRAMSLDRLCAGRGIHLAQALWSGDRVWLGPIGPVTPGGPSWTSGWRRRLAMRPAAPAAAYVDLDHSGGGAAPAGGGVGASGGGVGACGVGVSGGGGGVSGGEAGRPGRDAEAFAGDPGAFGGELGAVEGTPPAGGRCFAAAVAAQLAQGVLRSVTGIAGPPRGRLTTIEAGTLRSATHSFVPHPFAAPVPGAFPAAVPAAAAGFRDRVDALEGGPRLDPEALSRQAATCADDRTGVFGRPSEGGLAQLPLRVCQIEVSDPVGLLAQRPAAAGVARATTEGAAGRRAGAAAVVTGVGLDFATARLRAALRAFAAYASLMVDPRRLVDGDGEPLLAPGADLSGDPDAALDALAVGRLRGHAWGYRLADREPCPVPAARVFPALRGRSWPPPANVAAGYSWREAVEDGLLAHCRRLTLGEVAGAAAAYPRLDLAEVPLDDAGRRHLSILSAIGGATEVYDITGDLGVPTAACYRDGVPAGCASGRGTAAAVGEALLQAVLGYQAARDPVLADALPAVPELPVRPHGATVPPRENPPFGGPVAPVGGAVAPYGEVGGAVARDGGGAPVGGAVAPYGEVGGAVARDGGGAPAGGAVAPYGEVGGAVARDGEGAPAGGASPPRDAEVPLDLAAIDAALSGRGYRAVAVPLDHDPEAAAVMPYVAAVVLLDA